MTPDEIRKLNMSDALLACDCLDVQTRNDLIAACDLQDHRVLFALKVTRDWAMPAGLTTGIAPLRSNFQGNGSIGDFGEARSFIMKKRAARVGDPRAQKAKLACWTSFFYPEYRTIGNVRTRLITAAKDHAGLDSTDLMQANLFSLNGFFNWTEAQASARTHTTCGLFVRACRAAARLLEQKSWPTNTPEGTNPCITGPNDAAIVQYASRGTKAPLPGDIFHIAKVPTASDDNIAKNHVGIITDVLSPDPDGGWNWKTIEGGQGTGYLTTSFDRKLVLDKDGKRYHGGRKGETWGRELVKWIDLDALAGNIP